MKTIGAKVITPERWQMIRETSLRLKGAGDTGRPLLEDIATSMGISLQTLKRIRRSSSFEDYQNMRNRYMKYEPKGAKK